MAKISPRYAKVKGTDFQKETRDEILKVFPELSSRDIRSTPGGAPGEDLQLSSKAFDMLSELVVECKNLNTLDTNKVYSALEQCKSHGIGINAVFMRTTRKKSSIVVLDSEQFLMILRKLYEYK